ncbi:MAG TPA: DUF1553 domain-containing protein [Bryobacteraceae bacterium]|nr:DUF1553 domain-containing protein [Bryobacteraceae bacterium]
MTGLVGTGLLAIQAQEPVQNQQAEGASVTNHSDCLMFGAQRERYANQALKSLRLGQLTSQVSATRAASMGAGATAASMPSAPGGSRTSSTDTTSTNLIDGYIFPALKAQGVTPARMTNDYEFVRRIYLDMTGRIPTAAAVTSFVASTSPTKRADLIETLFAAPQWLDKWTMYFGDQFKAASTFPSSGTTIYAGGRDGLNNYIRSFLTNGTAYNKVALDLIASQGTNNFSQGELNWIITSRVTGGPNQDIWDGEAAAVAETFLGLSHMNCLLCHNGRGHLDTISLWAGNFTRLQAWGMSSFFSHIALRDPAVSPGVSGSQLYWYADDSGYKTDYALNTTTGNRPARQPIGSEKTVPPSYPFTGQGAAANLNYRQSLAAQVVADRQFARAAVNYMWAYFFGMGIVDPPDQFDPARLDPNNPPPAPWTLQPSNPELLEALTSDFIASGYSTTHLMRTIVNSQAYQLSSDYDPTVWNLNWQPLFARKLVRRLWSEEIADSISLSANIPNKFTFDNGTSSQWAMQYPEPAKETSTLLAAFLPGDRDTQPRKQDGAIQQALGLMNDSQMMNKLVSSGTGATQSLLSNALAQTSNANAINTLWINILSRYPTAAEMASATTFLSTGTKSQKMQELMWTLYNKVDFMFNY